MNLLRQAWHCSVTDGAKRSSVEYTPATAGFITTTTFAISYKNNSDTDNDYKKDNFTPSNFMHSILAVTPYPHIKSSKSTCYYEKTQQIKQ